MIQSWKPWEMSTGPKTDAGKDISKMNAFKHGARSELTSLMRMVLMRHAKDLKEMKKTD